MAFTSITIGNVPYNIKDTVVCAVTKVGMSGGTYSGTPVRVAIGKGTTIDIEATTLDPLTGYGSWKALATVIMGANFTLSMGGLDYNAVQIVGNYNVVAFSSPSIYYDVYPTSGGAGLEYFGMIMEGANADSGANVLIGLPMCKLDTLPSISINENDWTMSEISGKAMANDQSSYQNMPCLISPNNTQKSIDLTSTWFNDFFKVSA